MCTSLHTSDCLGERAGPGCVSRQANGSVKAWLKETAHLSKRSFLGHSYLLLVRNRGFFGEQLRVQVCAAFFACLFHLDLDAVCVCINVLADAGHLP